jgi:hypothetical protein
LIAGLLWTLAAALAAGVLLEWLTVGPTTAARIAADRQRNIDLNETEH